VGLGNQFKLKLRFGFLVFKNFGFWKPVTNQFSANQETDKFGVIFYFDILEWFVFGFQ